MVEENWRSQLIPVFRTFENDERLESNQWNLSELLSLDQVNRETAREIVGEDVWQQIDDEEGTVRRMQSEHEGGADFIYYVEGRTVEGRIGGFWGEFGPAAGYQDYLLSCSINFHTPHVSGPAVYDGNMDVIAKNEAPYLDSTIEDEEELRSYVEDRMLGTLDVPNDYDEDTFQESYRTAMTRIEGAEELQRVAKQSIEDFDV